MGRYVFMTRGLSAKAKSVLCPLGDDGGILVSWLLMSQRRRASLPDLLFAPYAPEVPLPETINLELSGNMEGLWNYLEVLTPAREWEYYQNHKSKEYERLISRRNYHLNGIINSALEDLKDQLCKQKPTYGVHLYYTVEPLPDGRAKLHYTGVPSPV